jgi:hypothetical protein
MQTLTVKNWSNETTKVDIEFLSQYKNRLLKNKGFQWACDSCLSLKKAIKANPTKQTYCDHKPILAYYDQTYNCDSCKSDFIFSKKEQKFWYEELGFWIQSKPKHCKDCRKEKRREKEYHKRIGLLKEKEENLNVEEIAELAEIYNHFGNEAKRNMYLNILKKKA